MNAGVRALSSLLVAWLTAAASFAPCCWSMANAHDHHAYQKASGSQILPHEHHNHDTADSSVAAAAAPEMSPVPGHDCNTEFDEAVATTRAALSFVDLSAAGARSADVVAPQVSMTRAERSDSAPPGGAPDSAFLNPLRI